MYALGLGSTIQHFDWLWLSVQKTFWELSVSLSFSIYVFLPFPFILLAVVDVIIYNLQVFVRFSY